MKLRYLWYREIVILIKRSKRGRLLRYRSYLAWVCRCVVQHLHSTWVLLIRTYTRWFVLQRLLVFNGDRSVFHFFLLRSLCADFWILGLFSRHLLLPHNVQALLRTLCTFNRVILRSLIAGFIFLNLEDFTIVLIIPERHGYFLKLVVCLLWYLLLLMALVYGRIRPTDMRFFILIIRCKWAIRTKGTLPQRF